MGCISRVREEETRQRGVAEMVCQPGVLSGRVLLSTDPVFPKETLF